MDSIVFPSNIPISTTSLVQFILKYSQSYVRLQTTLQLCNRSCLKHNLLTSHSYSRLLFRSLRNRLRELSLVREKIREISVEGKKLTKKTTNQLRELRIYSSHLIKTIRKLRQSSVKASFLHSFILDRIQKFNNNSKQLNSELIHNVLALFNHTSNDGKPKKNLINSNKTKSTKKATKYSTHKSSIKTKDEL